MKKVFFLFFLLQVIGDLKAQMIFPASQMTNLTACSLDSDGQSITATKDGSSVLLGDSIDFGDGTIFNTITLNFRLTYGEIYGQRTGEFGLYIDNEVIPFATMRKYPPVSWDTNYVISQRFQTITGKHKVKVVWDWYTANLKTISLLFDTTHVALPRKVIKIACLGNSITEGTDAGDRVNNGYVGLLSQMMGEGYPVRNYGSSGATVCRNTYNSFSSGIFCVSARSFQPDIVTIGLGTNDTQPSVWNTGSFALNFEKDYLFLIEMFANVSSHPRIYLCLPPPIFPSTRWSHQPDVLKNEIIPIILKIAKEKGLEVIDFYTPLRDHPECYAPNDQLHPLASGHVIMATQVYRAIRGH